MASAKLRKVGGSTVVALPPALLDRLGLAADAEVGLSVEGGALLIRPARPRRRLEDLLAEERGARDAGERGGVEDGEWLNGPSAGREGI